VTVADWLASKREIRQLQTSAAIPEKMTKPIRCILFSLLMMPRFAFGSLEILKAETKEVEPLDKQVNLVIRTHKEDRETGESETLEFKFNCTGRIFSLPFGAVPKVIGTRDTVVCNIRTMADSYRIYLACQDDKGGLHVYPNLEREIARQLADVAKSLDDRRFIVLSVEGPLLKITYIGDDARPNYPTFRAHLISGVFRLDSSSLGPLKKISSRP